LGGNVIGGSQDVIAASGVVDVGGWVGVETGTRGEYSVKSTYEVVSNLLIIRNSVSPDLETAFKAIWKCYSPSKVSGLVWMVLLDRLPTRENLFRRHVTAADGDRRCVFCGDCLETATHIFLYCKVIILVWGQIFVWLGFHFELPHNILSLLILVATSVGEKHVRHGLVMIWTAVIWIIWRHRNRIIFENGVVDGASMVEDVKLVSWKWWIGKGSSPLCLLYEWQAEPVLCLNQ
jgi:hypothetical protein